MDQCMNSNILNSIIRFAMAQKNFSQKLAYLMKGFLFAPFLMQMARKAAKGDNTISVASQAGDDIYPLF